MKFGKLEDISEVDFILKPDHPTTSEVLAKLSEENEPIQFYFGCPAWSCKEWIGKIYPPKTKAKDFLKNYANQFNTIELNTTHYRVPTLETVERWKEESSSDFKFCPKIPQQISHYRKLNDTTLLSQEFCERIAHFEEKLGVSFMQLHPSFSPNSFGSLKKFVELWDSNIPLSIEFRHPEWFVGEHLSRVSDLFQKENIGMVITDVAGRRDVLHQMITTNYTAIRFVGNSLHPTDFQRIDEWVIKLKSWVSQGLRQIYFFVHEPEDILCPELSIYLVGKIKKEFKIDLPIPKILIQMTQGSLF